MDNLTTVDRDIAREVLRQNAVSVFVDARGVVFTRAQAAEALRLSGELDSAQLTALTRLPDRPGTQVTPITTEGVLPLISPNQGEISQPVSSQDLFNDSLISRTLNAGLPNPLPASNDIWWRTAVNESLIRQALGNAEIPRGFNSWNEYIRSSAEAQFVADSVRRQGVDYLINPVNEAAIARSNLVAIPEGFSSWNTFYRFVLRNELPLATDSFWRNDASIPRINAVLGPPPTGYISWPALFRTASTVLQQICPPPPPARPSLIAGGAQAPTPTVVTVNGQPQVVTPTVMNPRPPSQFTPQARAVALREASLLERRITLESRARLLNRVGGVLIFLDVTSQILPTVLEETVGEISESELRYSLLLAMTGSTTPYRLLTFIDVMRDQSTPLPQFFTTGLATQTGQAITNILGLTGEGTAAQRLAATAGNWRIIRDKSNGLQQFWDQILGNATLRNDGYGYMRTFIDLMYYASPHEMYNHLGEFASFSKMRTVLAAFAHCCNKGWSWLRNLRREVVIGQRIDPNNPPTQANVDRFRDFCWNVGTDVDAIESLARQYVNWVIPQSVVYNVEQAQQRRDVFFAGNLSLYVALSRNIERLKMAILYTIAFRAAFNQSRNQDDDALDTSLTYTRDIQIEWLDQLDRMNNNYYDVREFTPNSTGEIGGAAGNPNQFVINRVYDGLRVIIQMLKMLPVTQRNYPESIFRHTFGWGLERSYTNIAQLKDDSVIDQARFQGFTENWLVRDQQRLRRILSTSLSISNTEVDDVATLETAARTAGTNDGRSQAIGVATAISAIIRNVFFPGTIRPASDASPTPLPPFGSPPSMSESPSKPVGFAPLLPVPTTTGCNSPDCGCPDQPQALKLADIYGALGLTAPTEVHMPDSPFFQEEHPCNCPTGVLEVFPSASIIGGADSDLGVDRSSNQDGGDR